MNKNYTLYNGDCLEELKNLPDNSVDSIVTDPPYGLSFMGKKWDYDVPSVEIWEQCLRVLKPGGHLLAFAGTRTQHRMAVRIEDAGFEIRDMIAWVYGCLSEDTQIVTPDGNKPYTTINPGDLVLCYDNYNKEYSYQPVEEVYEYNIKDTAYRIQSDYTDQLVSRNHRCLVERGGREVFVFAEELGSQENIPFLEDLSNLQSTISSAYKSTGNEKQNLFKSMQKCNDWIKKFWRNTTGTAFWYGTSCLFSLWNFILPKQKAFGSSSTSSLFTPMQWSFAWRGMETTCPQRTPKLEDGIRESFSRKNDRGNQSELEGRNNLQATQRESQGSEVYSLSRGIFGYGTKRWLYNGASVTGSTTYWKNVESDGSGSPYQPRSIGQSNRKPDVVCEQQRPQTVREWSGHKTTLATITPFEYEGKIWCVKVPTGSFVAVRNGKAFTTGNSGFPKSMDVSKSIDKAAGVEREVKGTYDPRGTYDGKQRSSNAINTNWRESEGRKDAIDMSSKTITEPETADAKKWDGWGTALKPALEPITVARKPLEEKTVAANVLKYGTGAINIDDSRIPTNPDVDDPRLGGKGSWKTDKAEENVYEGGYAGNDIASSEQGRFPANLIHDGSPEVVLQFPNTKAGGSVSGKEPSHTGDENANCYGEYNRVAWDSYKDNGSAARFFYCAKTSKKDRDEGLDKFEDKQASGLPMRSKDKKSDGAGLDGTVTHRNTVRKNTHPTVKPTDLMRYLVRMVTPPGGTVLDPFMGSGSTGKGAMLENFKFIGIELDPDYMEIAEARIKFADPADEVFDEETREVVETPQTPFSRLFE